MELVQKLMKNTYKYLIYSPLTENILTECPCIYYLLYFPITQTALRTNQYYWHVLCVRICMYVLG